MSFIHSSITRFPIRRSGALQQTFYGSPPCMHVNDTSAARCLEEQAGVQTSCLLESCVYLPACV